MGAMAANLALQFTSVSSLPCDTFRPHCANLPSEENVPKIRRFAALLDGCSQADEKIGYSRGLNIICHAHKQRERIDFVDQGSLFTYEDDLGCIGYGAFDSYSKSHAHGKGASIGRFICHAKKKKPDWFDYGEEPRMIPGRKFTEEGLQPPEHLTFPPDPNNEWGFLDFPAKYNPELSSLPLLTRKDVRKCCCVVAGGVYENLLFFPVIQFLKERYPGVAIDVVATARGKQTYEINKNVKYAHVYDVDSQFVLPAEWMEFVGNLKNEYYDLLVSSRVSGMGHSFTLSLTCARDTIAYVFPNVNAAGAGLFLSDYVKAPCLNLAEGGYHMYADLIELLRNPQPKVPFINVRPLEIAISKRVKSVVQQKYEAEQLVQGEFLVFHGIESTSNASMQSRGDPDCLLPLELWAEIAKSTSLQWVIVVPYEPDKKRVHEIVGPDSKAIFITTPGQLAALINDSLGVMTTNTAAVQLACALKKPSVALFGSKQKASLFAPYAEERRCTVVASATGKLADVDVQAAIEALKTVKAEMVVA